MVNRKRIVTGIVVSAAALALAYFALRGPVLQVTVADAVHREVSEFIAEDAKTRLRDEYMIDMPVSGTLERIALEVGAEVSKGDVLARVNPYELERQLEAVDALIAQARARITGVDVAKPKAEQLKAAEIRVAEGRDTAAITRKELEAGRVNLTKAAQDYRRISALYEQGAVSQSDYEESDRRRLTLEQDVARLELAERVARKNLEITELARHELFESVDDNEYLRQVHLAEIQRLEAQRAILLDDRNKTGISAPVDSVLLEKYIEDARVLQAGTPLLRLGDLTTIEIESDILSEEITHIAVGNPVEISGKALRNTTITGRVTRIYPSGFKKISALGIEQQRVKILVGFDNSALGLRPGTSVDIKVITDRREDTLAVPERATFKHEDGWAVFTVTGGRARITPVAIGLRNDEWAEILEGLAPGDGVVTERRNELEDGVRIAPMPIGGGSET